MKLGILGDIHGNYHALKAVIDDGSKQLVNKWICLGDLFIKGPQPSEVAELIVEMEKKKRMTVILGNTDQWILNGLPESISKDRVTALNPFMFFARRNLSLLQMKWLSELPLSTEMRVGKNKVFATHSSVKDIEKQVLPFTPDENILDSILGKAVGDIKYVAYGHIHIPFYRKIKDVMVFNPGSVGLPFDGDPEGSYAILEGNSISFRRAKYNIKETLKEAENKEFPQVDKYSKALTNGIQF